jgi:hypothetical protein
MFKPANANKTGGNTAKRDFDPNRKYPEPKAGSRPARISLIVDLGIQEREDFEDPDTGELKPQKPAHQVAVFADLTHDVVDYGGEIGNLPYRLCLNKTFQGKLEGVNFTAVPPRDAKGNMIEGKKWGFHPANLLTKIAKATGNPEVIESMDIEVLLDKPFMATVEVKKTESKDKKDDNGNPVVFTNVNFKGASEIPDLGDGPIAVKPLPSPAKCITFDNATAEDLKTIRYSIIQKIKTATNYAGSAMQKAVEEFEASREQTTQQEPPAAAEPPLAATRQRAPAPPARQPDFDDDIPF